MNTAVRAIAQDRYQPSIPTISLRKQKRINMWLIIALLISAFAVIYIKDVNRRLFIQVQGLQASHDKLYEDWGQLLLEQSTWSREARVKKIAQNRLAMNIPSSKEVVILKIK